MAKVTESDIIVGVYVVDPAVHGDARGFFVETYRRQWFPQGREMIQGNRGDRQAGALGADLKVTRDRGDEWRDNKQVCTDNEQGYPTHDQP